MPPHHIFRECTAGYKLSRSQEKINHLMYMDDIKLFAKNEKELETLIHTIRTYSQDIGMEFSIEKWALLVMKSVKRHLTDGIELPNQDKIRTLAENETYKYLGILEADTTKQVEMKTKIQKDYLRRTRKLLETKLNSRNLIKGINTWAVTLVRYSRPFLKWTRDEVRQMDKRTRKLMTIHKSLHPRDDVDRLYVPRKEGRTGLASIEDSVDTSIQRLKDYIEKHERRLITIIKNNTGNTIDKRMLKIRKQKWEEKQLHGRFKRLINILLNKPRTWLRKGNLKREIESLLIAAQNSAIRTNHIKTRIDKTQQNSKCRLCGDRDETINHIISECSKLAQKEYKARHDWLGKVIHWEMCKKFKFDNANKWYIHNPAPVLENDTHNLLRIFDIQTDHLISVRRPDLIIINEKKKICKMVDFSVPADHRIKLKEFEKKNKYLDLARKLKKKTWKMKVTIIPIVIGAFGTVTKGLLKGMEDLEVGGRVETIQTSALLKTARILRRIMENWGDCCHSISS